MLDHALHTRAQANFVFPLCSSLCTLFLIDDLQPVNANRTTVNNDDDDHLDLIKLKHSK